jgi:hypothetical protein
MDVSLAWTIAAFFLGAIVTRWNESRQHAAEVQAAQLAAYNAMQRDTWVKLQDALQEFSVEGHGLWRELVRRNQRASATGVPIDTTDAAWEDARQRAAPSINSVTALTSCIGDDDLRATVKAAVDANVNLIGEEVRKALHGLHGTGKGSPPLNAIEALDLWADAEQKLMGAVEALGGHIRKPPVAPVARHHLRLR